MNEVLTTSVLRQWLLHYADLIDENALYLTQLDAAIGDGDHGANMVRGMGKVRSRLLAGDAAGFDAPALLRTVGMALISNVGGAVGPLYGAFFLRASKELEGETDEGRRVAEVDKQALARAFAAGADGIHLRGKAEPGDKTMLDALLPAAAAMQEAVEHGASLEATVARGKFAAQTGAKSTIPMQANKGRASYLGARSVGHQDPGATSAALLVSALYESMTGVVSAASAPSNLQRNEQNAEKH